MLSLSRRLINKNLSIPLANQNLAKFSNHINRISLIKSPSFEKHNNILSDSRSVISSVFKAFRKMSNISSQSNVNYF